MDFGEEAVYLIVMVRYKQKLQQGLLQHKAKRWVCVVLERRQRCIRS